MVMVIKASHLRIKIDLFSVKNQHDKNITI